jgi:hypothetical protein
VITEHKSLRLVKPMHDAASRGDITEEHVTEHIHHIVVGHARSSLLLARRSSHRRCRKGADNI